jgi:hypothetical protein
MCQGVESLQFSMPFCLFSISLGKNIDVPRSCQCGVLLEIQTIFSLQFDFYSCSAQTYNEQLY